MRLVSKTDSVTSNNTYLNNLIVTPTQKKVLFKADGEKYFEFIEYFNDVN